MRIKLLGEDSPEFSGQGAYGAIVEAINKLSDSAGLTVADDPPPPAPAPDEAA